jgi:nitrite reductase (NADH) small subunit
MSSEIWTSVGAVEDFIVDAGSCADVNGVQVAIFRGRDDAWYAVENLCPHKKQMVISRGLVGSQGGEPKVACPLHKRNFSLKDGQPMGHEDTECLKTFAIKTEGRKVLVGPAV